jgi:hypothetical protein
MSSPASFRIARFLCTLTLLAGASILAACHHDHAVDDTPSNRPIPEDKAPPRPAAQTPPPPPVPGHTSR